MTFTLYRTKRIFLSLCKNQKTMSDNKLNNFKKLVKKVGKYKPSEAPKKPEKAPTAEQLREVYKLDKRSLVISKE